MPVPMARAASRYAGSRPKEEPQKTQTAAPVTLISALSMLPTGLRTGTHLLKPGRHWCPDAETRIIPVLGSGRISKCEGHWQFDEKWQFIVSKCRFGFEVR